MSVKEAITFKLLTRPHETNVDVTVGENEEMVQRDVIIAAEIILPVCLLKVVDEEVGKRAIGGGAKIEEDEVDTLLQLRDEEYEELISGFARFFTKDALKCLKNDYGSFKKGVIRATYTENAEVFWLFYYKGLLGDLEKLSENDTIPGYWLDGKKGTCYHILQNATSIKYRSVIKDKSDNILSWRQKIQKNSKQVQIDQQFLNVVKSTLASHKL